MELYRWKDLWKRKVFNSERKDILERAKWDRWRVVKASIIRRERPNFKRKTVPDTRSSKHKWTIGNWPTDRSRLLPSCVRLSVTAVDYGQTARRIELIFGTDLPLAKRHYVLGGVPSTFWDLENGRLGCMGRYRPTSSNQDDITLSDSPWPPKPYVLCWGDPASPIGGGWARKSPPKHGFVRPGQAACNRSWFLAYVFLSTRAVSHMLWSGPAPLTGEFWG